jgi:hypothetical protein
VSDFEDRLVALDPAAGAFYQHRDLDAMISRITAQPVSRKLGLWRRIEFKLAGTLITGALVTAGSMALFQGGAGLPVLAIQSAVGANAPKAFGTSASGTMQIYEKFNFTAGPVLSATTPTNLSFELQIPNSAASEAARVAAVFGVTGSPVNTSGNAIDWLVTSSSGSTLDYANVGVPQWTYSAAPSTNSSTSDLPSQATLASDVQRYLKQLGYGYTLAAPSFGTTTSSGDTGAVNSTSTEDVTYTVDVAGIGTDQSLSFSVDANNNVVSASGPAFSVGSTTNYPLQSLAAGVNALNAEQQSRFPTTAPTTSSSGTGTSSGVNPGATDTTPTTPSGPPVVNVILDADSLTLQTYQLTNGSLWLLPVYDYTGTITSADGSSSSATWNELAVDPNYVQVSGPGSSHGVINY